MSEQKNAFVAPLTAATVTTGGAVLALANPEGADLIVTRVMLDVTTAATGTPTLDVGIAADGTTSADTLLDAVAVGVAAGVFDNIGEAGTNGQSAIRWNANQFLTATASASAAGLVGNAYIQYVRV